MDQVYIISYFDLFNSKAEIIRVQAQTSDEAVEKMLTSKGWVGAEGIYDAFWSAPILAKDLLKTYVVSKIREVNK